MEDLFLEADGHSADAVVIILATGLTRSLATLTFDVQITSASFKSR